MVMVCQSSRRKASTMRSALLNIFLAQTPLMDLDLLLGFSVGLNAFRHP